MRSCTLLIFSALILSSASYVIAVKGKIDADDSHARKLTPTATLVLNLAFSMELKKAPEMSQLLPTNIPTIAFEGEYKPDIKKFTKRNYKPVNKFAEFAHYRYRKGKDWRYKCLFCKSIDRKTACIGAMEKHLLAHEKYSKKLEQNNLNHAEHDGYELDCHECHLGFNHPSAVYGHNMKRHKRETSSTIRTISDFRVPPRRITAIDKNTEEHLTQPVLLHCSWLDCIPNITSMDYNLISLEREDQKEVKEHDSQHKAYQCMYGKEKSNRNNCNI